MTLETKAQDPLIELTAEIVAAHVSHNDVEIADLPVLIQSVHTALAGIGGARVDGADDTRHEPAVPVRTSVKPDYIVCLEDGRKLKMMKRHLMTRYGMTPEAYRRKWNLPADYPMVAPNYAEKRRSLAKSIGLGTKANKH